MNHDWIWWLCLVVLIGLFVGVLYAVYQLGKLPGETAHRRHHPQASAIAACGWLGLLFPPLWPVSLVWAWTSPRDGTAPSQGGIADALGAIEERVAAIELDLGLAGTGTGPA